MTPKSCGERGWWHVAAAHMVAMAPTEVPLDPSPEVTPEEALDPALDLPLDLLW